VSFATKKKNSFGPRSGGKKCTFFVNCKKKRRIEKKTVIIKK